MDLHPTDQVRASSASLHELPESDPSSQLPQAPTRESMSQCMSGAASESGTESATEAALRAVTSRMPIVSDASYPASPAPRSPAAFDSGSFSRRYPSQGRDENRRAALSYIPPVMLAYFLGRRAGPYLRFHAAQGLTLTLIALGLVVVRWLVFGALDSVQSLAMVFLEIGLTWIFALICLTLVGLWIWGIIAALAGKDTVLPLVGRLAERILAATAGRAI